MVDGAWRGNGRGRIDSDELSDFNWNVDTAEMTSETMMKAPLINPIVFSNFWLLTISVAKAANSEVFNFLHNARQLSRRQLTHSTASSTM